MIRQLRFGAGVFLLRLPLDYESVSLLAVRGVLQVSLLVSGITPEELLDVLHDLGVGVIGGSPLPRSGSLVPFCHGFQSLHLLDGSCSGAGSKKKCLSIALRHTLVVLEMH